MLRLPVPILTYLQQEIVGLKTVAYIKLLKSEQIDEWGGDLVKFGIYNINKGVPITSFAPFLKDSFPMESNVKILSRLEVDNDVYADLHIFEDDVAIWILFLDAGEHGSWMQLATERDTELAQLREKYAQILEDTITFDVLDFLEIVVLKRLEKGYYKILTRKPDWFLKLFPKAPFEPNDRDLTLAFPYLESFLITSESFWKMKREGSHKSSYWTQTDSEGNEFHLEAIAVRMKERDLMIISSVGRIFEEKLSIIQSAREQKLEMEKELKSAKKKNCDEPGKAD